ncbi:deoxyuridine 5'-triphosphate nucleotidohydrolase [Mammaliicoccus phage vB_MscM-PMS3]|nr:deoxyuridine 5'-triphosphate nucleotidohydrolase [Mammaliicoccus phage vB_MscM-PMS3]WBF82119.1 deoxyuridine 5'-triphosphate nucleotidohydrolase [Mammaliicoccus virus vB_MscM-PMS2]
MKEIEVKLLDNNAKVPVRANATDSGLDLYSLVDVTLKPFESKTISTGIAINLEEGYEAQVRPKSGITTKTGLRIQLGTVDDGYIGELGVMVDNIKGHTEHIKSGQKIAQLVVAPVVYPKVKLVEEFTRESDRGTNGFGSTGLN